MKRAYKLAATVEKSISVDQIPSFPKLNIDNVRKGFFTATEVESVVAELEDALRSVVRFAFLTGWRRGEILSLEWSQVDWAAEELRLEPAQAKNKRGRTFPFGSYPPTQATPRRPAGDDQGRPARSWCDSATRLPSERPADQVDAWRVGRRL